MPDVPSGGGRNLLVGTNQGKANWFWAMANGDHDAEEVEVDGVKAVKLIKGTTTASTSWSYISYSNVLRDLIEASTKYTLSFDVNPSRDVRLVPCVMRGDAQKPMTDYPNMPDAQANQWQNISVVLTSRNPLPEPSGQVLYFRGMPAANGNTIMFKNVKLEKGETATPYSQAPEDLGWSMDTLVPTQQQRYLWKFEYIYYSDGSVEVTSPINISIAGADGTNGQNSHVHFAFADNATGGGFSLTTPKAYMGWYADFNETASNDPTKYKWGKWKGDQGVRGDKGDDGKTSYLHLAFASSADGKTGFSFTESGQQYQGYYTDFTQSSSTDPTKYTWMDRRAGVEVGTRNLWIQSKATGGFVEEELTDNHITGQKKCYRINSGKEMRFIIEPNFSSRLYQKVTFSAWIKYDDVVQGTNAWNKFNVFKHNFTYRNSETEASSGVDYLTLASYTGTSDWQYVHFTHDYTNSNYDQLKGSLIFNLEGTKSGTAWVTGVMVQFGNVATGHVWAPEDVQADIDSKADQALTQQQLNALAEQNSIVKAEMEAKASIDTVNQWITAYQNYVNANDEAKAESERNLQEASARILQLKTDVGTLRQQWDFIDTYMTVQNEGLIIGKSDGSAYAKFANDRISLFSGSSEVMYISQGVLRIENGIFTKTIQIGRFRFETHPADADMLVLRYLGG
ncbi:hypothetical protein [Streptococcus equinus]|uniref:hypothetical protein n=1 Tax=Streptococcus equinus TaxID=1335 RepID=UPI003BF8E2DF